MVLVNGLNKNQKDLIHTLVGVLKQAVIPTKSPSTKEKELLALLMEELYKKH